MAEAECLFVFTRITPIGYKQHVKAAEATLIIAGKKKFSNSAIAKYAKKIKRPFIISHIDGVLKDHDPVSRIAGWIKRNKFKTLNCAVSQDILVDTDSNDPWDPVIDLMLYVMDALSDCCDLTDVNRIHRERTRRKPSTGRLYRHGDLLIRQIKRLPKNLIPMWNSILAAGEETGHCHELHSVAGSLLRVYENSRGIKYFKTDHATLTHQEHNPITIEKGFYSVKREREYDYSLEYITPSDD